MGQFFIPGLTPANIKAGVNILGVDGSSSVVDTSDATATAAQILAGVTAYINGTKTTGSMVDRGTPIWTPGATDQILSAGRYTGGTVKGDPNLLAANIRAGVTLFGVAGAAPNAAKGTAVANTNGFITVTGLAFQPSLVVVWGTKGNVSGKRVYTPTFSPTDTNGSHSIDNLYVEVDSTAIGPATRSTSGASSVTSNGFTTGMDSQFSGATLNWFAAQ